MYLFDSVGALRGGLKTKLNFTREKWLQSPRCLLLWLCQIISLVSRSPSTSVQLLSLPPSVSPPTADCRTLTAPRSLQWSLLVSHVVGVIHRAVSNRFSEYKCGQNSTFLQQAQLFLDTKPDSVSRKPSGSGGWSFQTTRKPRSWCFLTVAREVRKINCLSKHECKFDIGTVKHL